MPATRSFAERSSAGTEAAATATPMAAQDDYSAPVEHPAPSTPSMPTQGLPAGLVWETESETEAAPKPARERSGDRPAGGGMRYGRQPALKSPRASGFAPPATDPNRKPTVSEAPASAPRTREPEPQPSTPRREMPRVQAEVREVKGPLPGVDASRYRAAEAPISQFASETPGAWDEDPKEHD